MSKSVHSIVLLDREGKLWFGTIGGVSRYDGFIFQNLYRRDGLPDNSVGDIFQDQEGDIWISSLSSRWLTRYRPQHVPPPIFLKGVIGEQPYGPVKQLRLPSSNQSLIFEFMGISFKTRPNQMAYVYRLIGYDETWRYTRKDRVQYSKLPSGDYIFQVEAVDRDLVYSEKPASVSVTINPPYEQIALVGSLGIALVGFVIASGYALKQRQERNRTREALMQEMENELQTAHDMQMGLMPTESPKIQGFDISGRCIPASQVGGDFFQYFPISDNRIAISLADVTGHGMEAAVPVMMFSGILDTQMEAENSLEDLFAKLNRSLHRNLDKRTFVCFAMGELNTVSRNFRLSNGACPYPYHYKAVSGEITELQVTAFPLGARAESTYSVIETQLESGDRIVFCSDGIIEAANASGEMFGFEQTAETIQKSCKQDLSAPQLLDYLINEVKTFTGEASQEDDQTVVVLAVES